MAGYACTFVFLHSFGSGAAPSAKRLTVFKPMLLIAVEYEFDARRNKNLSLLPATPSTSCLPLLLAKEELPEQRYPWLPLEARAVSSINVQYYHQSMII